MRPKHILLIRHLESSKNVGKHFSSNANSDVVTENGLHEGKKLSRTIAQFIADRNLYVKYVHATESRRAVDTAKIISQELSIEVKSYIALRSLHAGVLAGVSEEKAKCLEPEFMSQLALYRAGIINAYNMKRVEGKEPLQDFENRVLACFNEIIEHSNETAIILVSHRSPITAILLSFARKYLNYPKNFYGYVSLDLGQVSWLEQTVDEIWHVRAVNVSVQQFLH